MEINKGRWTAQIDGDFVVFLIGADLRDPEQAGPAGELLMAMIDMLGELEQDPTKGLLGYQVFGAIGGVIVQYWRSFEALESYAKNPDAKHAPVWRAWNRLGEDGTALGRASGMRPTRSKPAATRRSTRTCPATGLQRAGEPVTVTEARLTARQRMGRRLARCPARTSGMTGMAGFPEAGCKEASMFELTGHRALVTGAGDGMGVGIAHALARQGAAVAVNDIVASKAEATRDAILAAGGTAVSAPFDITDESAVQAGIAGRRGSARRPHRHPGEQRRASRPTWRAIRFRDLPPGRWRSYIDINLYGSLHCIAAVIEPMVEAHWGRIIQISSGAGRTGLKIGVSLYGASKSGIEGFIRHLSTEVASTGVTANALALGLMAAPNKPQDATVTAGIAKSIPVGRLGTPDDVGAAVVFLASEEMEWMTGQTVNLNGGSTFS